MARNVGDNPYEGVTGQKVMRLRYGENPHQPNAAFYNTAAADNDPLAISNFTMVAGESPSCINMTDLDRLIVIGAKLSAGLIRNACKDPFIAVAVKHGNVCGVGVGPSGITAMRRMIGSDPLSLSGGAVLVNFPMHEENAGCLTNYKVKGGKRIIDVVVAPEFTQRGKSELERSNGKCRMFENPALFNLGEGSIDATPRFRQVRGGFLTQDADQFILTIPKEWRRRLGSARKITDMVIAHAIAATATSNSIVLVEGGMLLGRGLAEPSRVGACEVAIMEARNNGHGNRLAKAVAASDSFFPFADGPIALADAGVQTVFATSGSIRDKDVAEACKKRGLELYTVPDKDGRGFHGH